MEITAASTTTKRRHKRWRDFSRAEKIAVGVLWSVMLGGVLIFIAVQTQPASQVAPTRAPQVAASKVSPRQQYLNEVRSQSVLLKDSLDHYVNLVSDPKLHDHVWVTNVVAEIEYWDIVYWEAKRLTPPPGFAVFNGDYIHALAVLSASGRQSEKAIKDRSWTELSEAGDQMNKAIQIADLATSELASAMVASK